MKSHDYVWTIRVLTLKLHKINLLTLKNISWVGVDLKKQPCLIKSNSAQNSFLNEMIYHMAQLITDSCTFNQCTHCLY